MLQLPFFTRWFKKKDPLADTASMCGHAAVAEATVKAFGEETETTQERMADGRFEFCHECLGHMAIRCAWCKGPMFIGDPITRYRLSPDAPIPDIAAVYSVASRSVLGCGRPSCADTGADYSGSWVPAKEQRDDRWIGAVQPFPTMYERVLRSAAEGTGAYAVVNDFSDPKQTKPEPGFIIPERMPLVTE